jgi:hypothetical protein
MLLIDKIFEKCDKFLYGVFIGFPLYFEGEGRWGGMLLVKLSEDLLVELFADLPIG